DGSGNTNTCSFTVTVIDNQPPTITCPANITVNTAPTVCTSNVTFTVTANDNCGAAPVVSTPPSGFAFPVGTTVVTNVATDGAGNTNICTFTVTVRDNHPPIINCPVNMTVNAASGQCSSNVNFVVTSSDSCGTVTNQFSTPVSGNPFPVGTTTVTNTAIDNA